VGDVTISQDTSNPLSTAITSSLKVTVPSATTGYVGFSNYGYNGVPVLDTTYTNYFWMKGDFTGIINLRLVGTLPALFTPITISQLIAVLRSSHIMILLLPLPSLRMRITRGSCVLMPRLLQGAP
jgi:hypothetical protein